MRILRALGILAMAALCGVSNPAAAATSGAPVTVGAILSLTGNYAPLGEPERNALRLAERDINAHGGINGRPIRFDIQDDEGKADTAAQLATNMVGQKVAMIICCSLTPTSAAVASRVSTQSKVVQLFMTPTSQIWNTKNGVDKYVFEVTPRNEIEARSLLAYMKSKLHASKIALLHDDAPYGTQGAAIVTDETKSQGLQIVDDEAFPVTATDLTAQLQKIKGSGADSILIWTAAPAAGIAVRQIRQFGIKMNVVGSTGIVSDNFLKITGKDGDGVYADLDLDVTHPAPAQRAFMYAYRDEFHARPANFASFAWDAAHLAALALRETRGNADGDSVAHVLETMKPYVGSTGTYKFTAQDHNGMNARDVHIARDHNGIWETF